MVNLESFCPICLAESDNDSVKTIIFALTLPTASFLVKDHLKEEKQFFRVSNAFRICTSPLRMRSGNQKGNILLAVLSVTFNHVDFPFRRVVIHFHSLPNKTTLYPFGSIKPRTWLPNIGVGFI